MTQDQPSLGETPTKSAPTPVENMKVTIQPKKNCRKCHGLGRIGFIDGDQNNPLVCQCVIKIYKEVQAKMDKANKEAKARAALTPITPVNVDGAQPAPIPPAEIVPAQEVKLETTECANSVSDQPK